MNITFLGLGAMGARMAGRLIDAGHRVTVWNRSRERTNALRDLGAEVAATPREASHDATVVFAMVRDDEAARSVWLGDDGAFAGMPGTAVGVDCSTLSIAAVRDLHTEAADRGIAFLDAPVAGSRPQAEAGQLVFMVGGTVTDLERVKTLLEVMGGAVHHAGGAGAGSAVKLMVNALFGAQAALMAELIALAEGNGIDPAAAIEIVGATPVCSPAAKASAGAMLAGQWQPAFPIDLVAKDFGLVAAAMDAAACDAPVSRAAGKTFDDAVDEGFGADNITGVIQRYRPQIDRRLAG